MEITLKIGLQQDLVIVGKEKPWKDNLPRFFYVLWNYYLFM